MHPYKSMKRLASLLTLLLTTGLFAPSSAWAQQLLPGQELLLRYNFDEAPSGTQPTVDHGTAEPRVDGRFFNGATRTTDTPGGASVAALDVSGSGHILANYSSEVVDSLDGKLDNLDQTTVTLWVNLQEDPANFDRIFSTGLKGIGFQITNPVGVEGEDPEPIAASNFSLALDTADGTVPSYTNFDADKKWIFLAVTFDGTVMTEEMVHFYSGDPETESTVVRSLSTLAWSATTTLDNHLMIGRHSSAANREIEGYVDDLRIYRGVLTPEQIEEVRLENLQVIEPPAEYALLVRYNFDEAPSGNEDAVDLGEVDPLIAGRFFGEATRTSDTPAGHSLAALDLSASDARVLANQNDLDGKLDNLTAFTTTVWVNLQSAPRHLDRIFRAGASQGFGYRIVDPTSGVISASNFGLTLDISGGGIGSGVDFDADKKWIFLAVTFDASLEDNHVSFIAGDEFSAAELKASKALGSIPSTGVLDQVLSLGRHPTASTRFINGYLDDFRVYRGALSLEEIEAIRLENLGDGVATSGFDAWLAAYFDADELEDPAIAGPNADPDGDGVPNLLKYALGGSLGTPSREILPVVDLDSDAGWVTLTFVRPSGVTGVEFVVEFSTDLEHWGTEAVLLDSTPVENGIRETYRSPSGGGERGFLRLRILQE
jgi:hypothetical protein